jgi:hypothetical protein
MLYDPNWKTNQIDQTETILQSAADLIEKHGHLKNDLGDFTRGFCLRGALQQATLKAGVLDVHPMEINLTGKVGKFLNLQKIPDGDMEYWTSHGYPPDTAYAHPAIVWNNAPERTKEEVVQALRDTANAL